MEFNQLEKDILRWFIDNTDNESLRKQVALATIQERKYTGAGFFVNLSVPPEAPKIQEDSDDINPYPGPYIHSSQLDAGGNTILFVNDGIIVTLEIFAYGDNFPEHIEQYKLREPHNE